MNHVYNILIAVFLIMAIAVIVSNNIGCVIRKVKIRPEEELMQIVNVTIDREFKYVRYLEYELKDVVLINNYEEEIDKLVNRTMNAFSSDLIEELEYYYTLNYITKHVTKSHQILLNMFIKEKKINNNTQKRKK
ncbi:hypothetical protein [Romboutsia ilealis]|uniref:hypothetical protein n=1 Tax=Romboutsia ilealis TaxID=1115758 RepID=UPI00272B6CA3|nr:hypothetical protein [Romboutsia ilealis]